VTWALLQRHQPEALAGLAVIARSPLAPGLPLITSATTSAATLGLLREALQQLVSDERYRPLCEALFICGYSDMRRADYQPLLAWRDEAARASCGCRRQFPGPRRKRLARATRSQAVVNRSPAKRSASREKPQQGIRQRTFPEAARCACPGYRSADGCEPVARLSAAQAGKKTAARHRQRTFPGGGALRLSGLPIRRR
jgi:hypothetical protein